MPYTAGLALLMWVNGKASPPVWRIKRLPLLVWIGLEVTKDMDLMHKTVVNA